MFSRWLLGAGSPPGLPRGVLGLPGEPLASWLLSSPGGSLALVLSLSSLLAEQSLDVLFSLGAAVGPLPPCGSGWGDPVALLPWIQDTLGLVEGSGGRGLGFPGEGGGLALPRTSEAAGEAEPAPSPSSSRECLERREMRA